VNLFGLKKAARRLAKSAGGPKPSGSLPKAAQKGFFSDYPRFLETSSVAANLARLNFRYDHIIAQNKHLLEGKRVLDIASHDGRFSFAALKGVGAAHALGIEARGTLVQHSNETLAHYGIAPDRYKFVEGDVFEAINRIEPGTIDTVMVLGFLYHTARQYELASAISRLGAKAVIIDSNVIQGEARPIVKLKWEGTEQDSQIWDATRKQVLSSQPSASALRMFFEEFGFKITELEPTVSAPESAQAYRTKARVTMIGTRD
jgi:hypothetical protein